MNPQAPAIQPNVPLTPQQVQTMRTQIGVTPVSGTESSSGSAADWSWLNTDKTTPKTGNAITDTVGNMDNDIENTAGNVKNTLEQNSDSSKRNTKMGTISEPSLGNELNTGLQVGGEIAGGAMNTVGELPGLKQIGEATNATGQAINSKLMNNPEYSDFFDKAVQMEDRHPTITKDLGSVANIANASLMGEGIKGGVESISDVPNAAKDTTGSVVKTGAKVVQDTANVVKAGTKGIRSAVTKLPNEVSSTLKEGVNPADMKNQLQNALSQGKDSLKTGGKVLDPYEQAGRDYLAKAVGIVKNNAETAGKNMEQHAADFKNQPVDVSDIMQNLSDLSEKRLGTVFNGLSNGGDLNGKSFGESLGKLQDMLDTGKHDPTIEGMLGNAEGRNSIVTKSSDRALLGKTFTKVQDMLDNGVTGQKLSDVVRELKNDLDYQQSSRPKPINTPTEGVVKQIVHDLGTKVDELGNIKDESGKTINPYKDAKTSYSKSISLIQDLNKRLGGSIGENGDYKNASSMLIRRLSPQDGGTRAVLRELENQTGIPVFQHAIIAKFAMDTLKDSRVRSVLENMKNAHPSKGGVIHAVWNTIKNAVEDPEGKAVRILDKRIGKEGTQQIYAAVKDNLPIQQDGGTSQ